MAVSRYTIKDIFCYCYVLLLLSAFLITVASASPESMKGNNKRKPYKFMRWGKRFFDDTDVLGIESSEEDFDQQQLPIELEIPVFGNSEIICVKINEGGIYQCSQYYISADSLRNK